MRVSSYKRAIVKLIFFIVFYVLTWYQINDQKYNITVERSLWFLRLALTCYVVSYQKYANDMQCFRIGLKKEAAIRYRFQYCREGLTIQFSLWLDGEACNIIVPVHLFELRAEKH